MNIASVLGLVYVLSEVGLGLKKRANTNEARDGTFRNVQVEVIPPRGTGKLTVRTRAGYYAARPNSGN